MTNYHFHRAPRDEMDPVAAEQIKAALGTTTLKWTGFQAAGCINHGYQYEIDNDRTVFIKWNDKKYAKAMFRSEIVSLDTLIKTDTVRVPLPMTREPLKAGPRRKEKMYCILEFVPIRKLQAFSGQLGQQMAELHLHNEKVLKGTANYVSQFGFPIDTCVGMLPVKNTWNEDWTAFYTRRLEEQVSRIPKFGNPDGQKEFEDLWFRLQPLIPKFFENIEVKPSLLHGDLWTGNVGETETGPIIFDPGCVYGHHEFDIAMTTMFGKLDESFYTAYHKLIPKAPGFEAREVLYHLFHYLNHWSHFGHDYRSPSLSTLRRLVDTKFPLT